MRTQRLSLRLGCALVVGLAGVAVLVSRSVGFGVTLLIEQRVIALVAGRRALLVAGLGSHPQRDSACIEGRDSHAQMLSRRDRASSGHCGNVESSAVFVCVEVSPGAWLRPAVPDRRRLSNRIHSLRSATHHESPTKVGTYAYVNPWRIAVVL